jgi:hypothetical protein
MRSRFLVSLGVISTLVAVAPFGSQPAVGVAATVSQRGAATSWAPSRTLWGEPDLQGVWGYESAIPFERPAKWAGSESLTPDEIAAAQEAEKAALAKRLAGADFQEIGRADQKRSPIAGNEYNQFWFETGRAKRISAQTSMIVDPPDGRMPSLNEELRAIQVRHADMVSSHPSRPFADSWTDRDTGERCLTDGLPGAMWMGSGPSQIVQGPGYVIILHEMFRDRRIIPTDGRPRASIPQWFGQSVGRWEGKGLVIETRAFAHLIDPAKYVWQSVWRAPTETLHVLERLTRVAQDTIEYQMTLTDPRKFARPWTVVVPLSKVEHRLFEYACHEGNYAMLHLLSEARNVEKASTAK